MGEGAHSLVRDKKVSGRSVAFQGKEERRQSICQVRGWSLGSLAFQGLQYEWSQGAGLRGGWFPTFILTCHVTYHSHIFWTLAFWWCWGALCCLPHSSSSTVPELQNHIPNSPSDIFTLMANWHLMLNMSENKLLISLTFFYNHFPLSITDTTVCSVVHLTS